MARGTIHAEREGAPRLEQERVARHARNHACADRHARHAPALCKALSIHVISHAPTGLSVFVLPAHSRDPRCCNAPGNCGGPRARHALIPLVPGDGRHLAWRRSVVERGAAMASEVKDKQAKPTNPAQPEPKPPFPRQHQDKPGIESKLRPRPRFEAEDYRAAGKLKDKAALITGGDSGIGRAVAVLFAREGADVAIAYLPQEQSDAEETRKFIEAEGRQCLMLPGDLTDAAYCDSIVDKTVEAYGRIDVLVSNAAHQNRKESLDELTDEELDRTFKTNIYAYIRLSRAALRHMKAGASIIATSSVTGILGSSKLPDYSSTKGAINAFTKTLAQALVEKGIRVNAVAPGPVWTPLNPADEGLPAEKVAEFGKDNPMGRPAQPEEVAPAYVFLASNADSSYITGIVLQVMGGETAGG
jgi:NAD(P)-dependent dehydrogenase (short-subunit alcohol dehydrogenase family)